MRKLQLNPILQCFAVIPLLWTALAAAQEPVSIAGKIADSKGSPIPGASVRISSGETSLAETLSDLDGAFRFEGLPAGEYKLTVEIVGFVKHSQDAVDATAESSKSINMQLASLPRPAPPRALAQQRADRQQKVAVQQFQSFQTAEVTDLPGLSLFKQDQTQETADTIASTTTSQDKFLFISGNTLTADSGDMNNPAFRGEMMGFARQMGFQMQEFSPGGEGGFGGGMGGSGGPGGGMAGGGGPGGGGPGGGGPGGAGMGFSSMMGRGGRNASFKQPVIQGSLSENYGNSALNARNYSLTGQTLDKPVQIQNDFSVTLGGTLPFIKSSNSRSSSGMRFGPISRPGWSFSYSGNRNRSARDVLATVPTDLERIGDFSQSYTQALVTNTATGEQSVVNQLARLYLNPNDATTRFTKLESLDPIAAGLLQYIPHANLPCAADAPCVNNYYRGISLPSSSNQIQASVSGLKISSKDSIGINYSMRRGSSLNAANFPGLDSENRNLGQNIGISGTHAFKPRLIVNWRVSLNRMRTEANNKFSYTQDVEGDLGITGVSQDPLNWGPPTLNFTGYSGLSLAVPSISRNQTLSVSGGFNKMGRKHSIRSGGDVNWAQRNSQRDSNARGTYSFTGFASVLLDANGRQVSGTGNEFADFLRGLPYSTSRSFVDKTINPYGNSVYLRSRNYSLYVMDDWRVRSNLTVNIGLRYEYSGPSYEKYDRLVSLDATSDFTSVAQVFPDEDGPLSGKHFSRSMVAADRNNIAPRVGIAWRPTQKSPFVFRAGYGIGYNTGGYSSVVGRLTNQAPFAVTQNLASTLSDTLTLRVGFPSDPSVTILNTFAIDPNYKPSYIQQWNLDVQTQISRIYVLSIGYSGSKGTGLDVMRAPNRSSNSNYFIYQTNGASSIYHGLSVQLSRRFSHGFNLSNSYTFSKSIDNALGSGGSAVAQHDGDLKDERALSDQDQRHNFQTNFAYELPIGQNRAFFAASSTRLLNFIAGWTFNGSFSMASGAPITPRYASGNGSASGAALYNSLRPDVTGLPVELSRDERTVLRYFNTAAFAIPAGSYGTAARNSITGPGSIQLNLSVRKSIRLDEQNRRLDFSWQVQNALNHPNWGGVSTTINSSNFGQVTSVRSMRSMTMNLRVSF